MPVSELLREVTAVNRGLTSAAQSVAGPHDASTHATHAMGTVGRVSTERFDPMVYLKSWNFSHLPEADRHKFYQETKRSNGTLLREYQFFAVDRELEIAPGVFFPAWTYQRPGARPDDPRDRRRSSPRQLSQSGHPSAHDSLSRLASARHGRLARAHQVLPGESFVYEFDAEPFGLHLYHCHAVPLKRHIHKGLYGVFIVDPNGRRGRRPTSS